MNSNKNLREVEVSPDGRYVRFDEKLGNGAYKEVFLAYDTETGKEVAWNTVTLARLPPNEKKRIRMETEILKELDHPHIINFFHVWENPDRDQICFTTEIVTSGTLKQYVHRVRNVKLKVIKKWCRQILTALDYLHIHSPPIIHRDLKCDNIFINGGTGEIRIGDFGLSAARHTTHVESVLGTPEFMAPELYDENYSEGVDIYAFGCCVLEMTTKEYPYEECSNAAQIWKKVSMGQKPEVLSRILNKEVKAFIECCLRPADERLSARELLKHPFLKFKRSDPGRDNITVLVEPRASPTHRQGKDEQREKLQGCMWAREKEKEIEKEKERVDRERLYNPSQTHNNTAAHHRHSPHQNSLDYGGDALISPVSAASSRMPPVAYHPPHINTSTTPTPTHQQQMEHNLHSGAHTDTHPHPHPSPQAQGHHPPSSSHHPSESHPVPNSAQTPPARLNRQISLPTMGQNATGLTHSQSSHAMNSLQHPQPQRLLSTPTVQHPPNLSPDLIHVSSVVVEVESVHSHFANIVLHIHFESGTRRKKQIRFEFDFYRDTSESIASEMVKALKLPDQERTARCIASNMELKIDPFRVEYFQKHHHANPNGTHTDPNSPANSPATKVKSIHPSNVTTAIHATAPSSHKNASPSPQHVAPAASPNSHSVTHKPMVHGSNTMPAPALSKVTPAGQPTGGSTVIRPTSAKPPLSHTLTPQMQRQVQQAVLGGTNVMVGAQSSKNPLPPTDTKSLGSRRHSHEPNSSNHWNESDHTHLPASRTSSVPQTVGLGVDPHGHHPSASPIRSANASGSSASSASSNGIRRSSSTSSLALMQAPSSSDEAANKLHHDRLFEEYRKLSIANLKDKIKARIREKRESGQSDGEESDASQEGIELNGILEKSDLIESLIRMTPRHRTELSSSKPSTLAVTPSHAPSASSQSHHHSLHHAHSFPSPPSPREHSHDLPSDSSAASTPRIPQAEHSATLDNSASSTNSTPYQRSRTHSIDVHHSNASEMLNENAILGAYANIKPKQSLNTSTTSANNAHPFSPLSSPSQSPVPSPAAKSLQDRHRTSSHADEPFQASSHRMMSSAAGGNGSLLPSSLTRSISSPNQLATTISSYTGSNTFPSNLHVDVHPSHSIHSNPISPSNGQSETSFSPNQIPPPALASTSAGHHGRLNVPSSSTPHGVHPQSPTIPEESDKDEEAVETRKLKQRASPHSNNLPSTFPSEGPYSTPNVHPSNNNFLNHPPTQPHSHSDHSSTLTSSASSTSLHSTSHDSTFVKEPIRRSATHSQMSSSSSTLSGLPLGPLSIPSGGGSHSASSTPSSSNRGGLTSGPSFGSSALSAAHQRSSSVMVGGLHSATSFAKPELELGSESEEKKKATAERARLQKKDEAAKAAKLCEDKILSGLGNFTLH